MAATPENFSFTIRLIKSEKSKDSHSRYETWTLTEGNLQYEKRYSTGRFKNKPPVEKQKQLSGEDLKKLRDLIVSKNLLQEIEEPKRSEFQSPYTATSVVWTFSEGEKIYTIRLYDLSTELELDPVYKELSFLIAHLDLLINA